jgi:ribosomal protein S18 acetylase RimI-like enzyme
MLSQASDRRAAPASNATICRFHIIGVMTPRRIDPGDLAFVREELVRNWHDVGIWSVGRRYQGDQLPGFVAVDDADADRRVGLVTYHIEPGQYQAEIVTLSSRVENAGVATALLAAAVDAIAQAGCVRVYLRTTNDNLRALGFYQKRGWKLCALHAGYIDEARKRVPVIPVTGMHGIPLRDEIELERWLR